MTAPIAYNSYSLAVGDGIASSASPRSLLSPSGLHLNTQKKASDLEIPLLLAIEMSSAGTRTAMHNSSKPTAAPLIPARFSQENPGVSDVPSDAAHLGDAVRSSSIGSVLEMGAVRAQSDVAPAPTARKLHHPKPELESLDFSTLSDATKTR